MQSQLNFSVFTKPWKTLPVQELGELVHRMGFSGIEFPLRDGYQAQSADADVSLPKLASEMKAYGITITSVASSLDERVFAACEAAGVPLIRIMIGHDLKKDFYRVMTEKLIEVEKALPLCEKYNVRIGIQQHHGPGINNSMEMRWFVDKLNHPSVGGIWDSAHSALAGEEPEQALDVIWDKLFLVNLKNACYKSSSVQDDTNRRFVQYFTPGDQGMASWKRVAGHLQSKRYEGNICFTAEYSEDTMTEPYVTNDLIYFKSLLH